MVDCSGPVNLSPDSDGPTVSYITNDLSTGNLEEGGIDLSEVT